MYLEITMGYSQLEEHGYDFGDKWPEAGKEPIFRDQHLRDVYFCLPCTFAGQPLIFLILNKVLPVRVKQFHFS